MNFDKAQGHMVICSYHWAVIVSLLKTKSSKTREKSFLHSNITMLLCSKTNSRGDKFHWELVIKIHELCTASSGFKHKFICFSMCRCVSEHVKYSLIHA